jgi:tetratricopeptide (TPR) repeat protein
MWDRKKPYPRRAFAVSTKAFAFAGALLGALSSLAFASGAEMYCYMGQEYMEEGNFDMAALAFEKAVELAPDWPEAHNALGEAYVQLLRFRDAIAEFDRALELRQDYPQARANRRRTMMSVQRYEPMRGSRLSRWHKYAILGGLTAAITVVSALIVYLSS